MASAVMQGCIRPVSNEVSIRSHIASTANVRLEFVRCPTETTVQWRAAGPEVSLVWVRDKGRNARFTIDGQQSDSIAPGRAQFWFFPEGIGAVECVNVEHEEVLLIPRVVDAGRVTFKYGLGEEFIEVLRTLHMLGLDSTEPVTVRGVEVSPRDVVAAVLPDPATLGERMSGRTCAGTWVRGTGRDGKPRSTYLYHLVDNEYTMREYRSQAVVWQTAINPAVALELLDRGEWKGTGVLGPEAFSAEPFLELLGEYGSPHGVMELDPAD